MQANALQHCVDDVLLPFVRVASYGPDVLVHFLKRELSCESLLARNAAGGVARMRVIIF